MSKKRIGWFSTGNGAGSLNLLKAVTKGIKEGDLDIEIGFLFCNRTFGEASGSDNFLDYAKSENIEVVSVSSSRFREENKGLDIEKRRVLYDQMVVDKLKNYEVVDYVVLAGYMLFAPLICKKFTALNLHPALPDGPKGTWKEVVGELVKRRMSESGVMLHIATDKLDDGDSAITKCVYNVEDLTKKEPSESLFREIRERQLSYEAPFLVESLSYISRNFQNEIPSTKGVFDLTNEVVARLN